MSGAVRAQLHGTSVARAVSAVLRREGWRGLYSGVRAQLLGTGCALAESCEALRRGQAGVVPTLMPEARTALLCGIVNCALEWACDSILWRFKPCGVCV